MLSQCWLMRRMGSRSMARLENQLQRYKRLSLYCGDKGDGSVENGEGSFNFKLILSSSSSSKDATAPPEFMSRPQAKYRAARAIR